MTPFMRLRGVWTACGGLRSFLCFLLWSLNSGCDRHDMYDQPRYEPLEASPFFRDGLSARPRVEGTIPRGDLREDDAFYKGKREDRLISRIPDAAYKAIYNRLPVRFPDSFDETDPVELRRVLLERGRERFDIYCSVCHSRTGDGHGMIVQRGFRKPPSLHLDRLCQVPAGHIFDVVNNGFGATPSQASRIDTADRWAIVAYVRALQFSQRASFEDLPQDLRDQLRKTDAPVRHASATSNIKPHSVVRNGERQ